MTGILDGLPPDVAASMMNTWGVLPDDAVVALVGALQEGSPLAELLLRYGDDTAAQLGDVLVRGLASGIGARKVADEMRRVLGIPLSDALRISRTEIMRSFRAATLADYRANAHIVRGWIWHSALDRRTCMGCIAMHGTEHTLSEELDDHPNGRCAAVPITVSPRDIGIDLAWEQEPIETGESWFERQPEAVQREMMGPGKYAAWKDGKFKVSDMVTQSTDKRWGTMRHERSLKDLLGGQGATTKAMPEPPKPTVPKFKNNNEAAEWLKQQGLAQYVSFTEFDISVTQAIAESLAAHAERYPEMRGLVEAIGGRNLNRVVAPTWQARLHEHFDRLIAQGKQTREGANALMRGRTAYGPIPSGTTVAEAMGRGAIFELSRPRAIYFNPNTIANGVSLNTNLEFGHAIGFEVQGAGGVRSLVDHEMGHLIADKWRPDGGWTLWESLSAREIAAGLSQYATKNYDEFLAEGWSEFFGSPSPRPLAVKIGQIMLSAIRGH